MATIKSYTDLEQSKKLAEILPLESADMYYDRGGLPSLIDKYVTHESIKNDKYHHLIPCWTLASLFDVLPKKVEIAANVYSLSIYLTGLYYWNVNNGNLLLEVKDKDSLVDACYVMILKLNEPKVL